jgi:hypothetical protein
MSITIIEKLLNKFNIYQSKMTSYLFLIGFIALYIIGTYFPDSTTKKIIMGAIISIVCLSSLKDILWINLQKKYIVKKCPDIQCDNIIKLKIDDQRTEIVCNKCGTKIKKEWLTKFRRFRVI